MTDNDAATISKRIQERHLVYGFISETKFCAPDSDKIEYTTGNGDAALWTGAYLAAEAFRYSVTKSETALAYLGRAIERVSGASHVASTGFVARTIVPLDSDFIKKFVCDEGHNGLYRCIDQSKDSYWEGHPTRDQYAGVLFGLGVAFDLVDDDALKAICRETIVWLTHNLIASNWSMTNPPSEPGDVKPDRAWFETFYTCPHHELSVLQLARHVDPEQFGELYEQKRGTLWAKVWTPLSLQYDIRHLRSKYYLLNLDHLYYYTLIRYEDDDKYRKRYLKQFAKVRRATRAHRNAHFNMIECALTGRDAGRDAETIDSLDQLLCRGFKDCPVDLNGKYKACGKDEACDPIPVVERPYEDFLWQRSPFNMKRDGDGSLESPGIDFILPYWMARHYGVLSSGGAGASRT